ncbi:MAG: ATP-dependent Clp protease adaptor ClpS [Planctomycetes bacterium]|nr:ATP-dependent Clp protease adaptor ClpS [Planctomycetota bacterium]
MVSHNTIVAEPAVVPKERATEKADSKEKPKRQPPYSIVVHNDDRHTWQYVIEVLQRVCGHPLERCYQLTAQVHYSGRAHVWTGTLELAELKRDQIRGFGSDFYAEQAVNFPLGVTIEPLPGD